MVTSEKLEKPKKKLYRTSDLWFATYLCTLEFVMIATELETLANGSKKTVFVFEIADEHLRIAKTQYFGGSGTVKARQFVDNLRNLKSLCHI
jgi:hypothetical protein